MGDAALMGLYYAGRELYGQSGAAASPHSGGLCRSVYSMHNDAQPMLIALAAYSGGLRCATIGRKPRLTGIFYGLALAVCLLGTGISPTLPLLVKRPIAWWLALTGKRPVHTGHWLAIAGLLILPCCFCCLIFEQVVFTAGWPPN